MVVFRHIKTFPKTIAPQEVNSLFCAVHRITVVSSCTLKGYREAIRKFFSVKAMYESAVYLIIKSMLTTDGF